MRGRWRGKADGGEGAVPVRGRPWVRGLGLLAVVALVAVALGLQAHLRTVRRQVASAEQAEGASLDRVQAATDRVRSVDRRAEAAARDERSAQAEVDRALAAMEAQGLDRATLDATQVATAELRDAHRSRYEGVTAAVAAQEQAELAAGSCLFDQVRTVARVAIGHRPGEETTACRAVAGQHPSRP